MFKSIKELLNKPKEMKTNKDKIEAEAENWAFRTFANIYPHEAYNMEPERFCDFVRTKHPELSDEDILKLLNETLDEAAE